MEPIKIGWAKREISTDKPVSIPGQMYMRISEGIHDPLYVTALCVDGGEGQDAVIFCTCDVVVLRGNVIAITLDKVHAKNPEIPTDNIIMGATHSHSAGCIADTPAKSPDGAEIYPGAKYREFFTDMAAEAICEAWETRKKGGFAFGYGYAVVAHSRRVVYLDDVSLRGEANPVAPNGHGVMYGNTNDDKFSHYEAGADHYLNALYTFDENKKLTGMIINVPCPSQISEHFTKLSADYWNEVREGVKKEFGEDVFVLPQCACAGDLSPRTLHYKQAQARRMALKYNLPYDLKKAKQGTQDLYNKCMSERYDIAERILCTLKEIYSWAKKEIYTEAPVQHVNEVVALERRFITDEEKEWCEANIKAMEDKIPENGTPEEIRVAKSRYNSIKSRNTRAIGRWELQKTNPTLPMKMHVLRIGDVAFATNRFELYMDFMHRIQARSPFLQTFLIQLAGDEGGNYLATERGKANKGYSASLFCNVVSPTGGQQIVDETVRVLKKFKESDPQ